MSDQTAVSTPDGVVRVGDFVHYHGSLIAYRGHLCMEVKAICSDGLVLETATGGLLRRVRPSSVSPLAIP